MARLLVAMLLQLLCLVIVSGAEDADDPDSVEYDDLPDGYVAYPDIYVAYKVSNEIVTWREARRRCLADGAQLAVIDSQEKIEYVMNQRETSNLTHVGIHRLFGDEEWVSVETGAPLSSLPWLDGEPIAGAFPCAAIFGDLGGLANYPCETEGGYVCQLRISDGYVAYPDIGVSYKIPDESVTWMEARRRCYNDGGELAVIDSAKKLEYVKNQRTTTGLTFVGIHSFFEDGEWVSAANGSAVSSIPWQEGEPLYDEYHCLVLVHDDEGLSNYPCDYRGNYVCERPISDDD